MYCGVPAMEPATVTPGAAWCFAIPKSMTLRMPPSVAEDHRHPALPDELVEPVPAGDGGADGEFLGHFGARRGGSLLGDRLCVHDGGVGAARRALRTVEAWQIAQIGEPRERLPVVVRGIVQNCRRHHGRGARLFGKTREQLTNVAVTG